MNCSALGYYDQPAYVLIIRPAICCAQIVQLCLQFWESDPESAHNLLASLPAAADSLAFSSWLLHDLCFAGHVPCYFKELALFPRSLLQGIGLLAPSAVGMVSPSSLLHIFQLMRCSYLMLLFMFPLYSRCYADSSFHFVPLKKKEGRRFYPTGIKR